MGKDIYPRKAVILAAGLGTRMQPLSFDTPKPLMPLWNQTLLERVLIQMADWGVRDVLINLHWRADMILELLRRRPPAGLRINYSFEPEILGTGGALRAAEWFLDEHPFWMVNADIVFDLDARPLIRYWRRHQPLAALWLTDQAGPRTVTMRDSRVTSFRCPNPGTSGTYTFTGLHLVTSRILEYLPASGYACIIQAYEKARTAGCKIAGICPPGTYWSDLGTPESYLAAHAVSRNYPSDTAGKNSTEWVARAPDARVARGADVKRTVLWSGARIGRKAVIHDAVIGRHCEIDCAVTGVAVTADCIPNSPALRSALTILGWLPTRTAVMPLPPRGSARMFTRLTHKQAGVIMIEYRLDRSENALYASHTRLLGEADVDTPRLLADKPRQHLLLFEDLGERSLQIVVAGLLHRNRHDQVRVLYRQVIDNMLRMHIAAEDLVHRRSVKLAPAFTPRLFKWEREFFARQFLNRAGSAARRASRAIIGELSGSARVLLASPYSLVHRDLQSTNILFRDKTPCFIDYQGMRFGSAAYDLASLLCDPYLELPVGIIRDMFAYYNRHAPPLRQFDEKVFWHAAVERLAQALGAYSRLGAEPVTSRFKKFIPSALRRMELALSHLDTHPITAGLVNQILTAAPTDFLRSDN